MYMNNEKFGDTINSGHYVIWTRNLKEAGWLRIDDVGHRKYKQCLKSLDNVQMLILKKN